MIPHDTCQLFRFRLQRPARARDVKTILYYTEWWPDHPDPASWDLGEGEEMFASCPHTNCRLTANTTELPIHQYSALLFHTWKLFARVSRVKQKYSC